MAIFRKVNNGFWEDEKVVDDFTPEDKYFMLYLMTNPHTNQVGCYSLTIRQMEFETGYNKDTILKLVKRFTEVLKVISYDENTKEVLILNWHKYNWTSSPKVIACIYKEAESIKSSEFRSYIDTLFIQYGYSIDSVCIPNRNKNKNKEQDPSIKPILKSFTAPTITEVQNYISEIGSSIDAENFIDYYNTNGWKIGKNPMKDWKAAVRQWTRRSKETAKTTTIGGLF